MAENNPGQENLAYDATTNKPRLDVDVTFGENTSLDDIKNKYTDISNQYNRFVTDARQNVADRQTERIGNDFGMSPYNTNTYYEPGVTNFASAMRQQGTQKALEVGMERGQKEAEANLAAAESAYQNAVTAYDDAYDNFQRTKNKPVAVTIDKSLLPEGVNEDEVISWISSAGSPAEGMQRAIDSLNINNAGVKSWNDADVVNKVKNTLGENSEAWKAYAQHMQEREAAGHVGVSERFGDTEVGRIWADTYAKEYFQANYDDSFTKKWQENYDKVRRLVTNLMGLRNDELSWTEVIIPKSDTPDNMSITADYTYIDIIQPEFKGVDKASVKNVKVNSDGSYTIDGKTYSFDEVRETVAKAQGKDLAKLDEQQAKQTMTPPALSGSDLSATQDFLASTRNNALGTKWQPTLEEIYTVYAGDDAYREMYSGYTEIPISANDVAEAVLGVDIAEARALARLADENPEGFEKLTDQVTKALTDTLVFEVADGVKEYHTRDGYKVLEAGTVVMNVPDSVLNEDGSVRDKDLEKMIQLYQDYDDPTVDKTALMDEYVTAWQNYALRLLWARGLTNQTDELIDSDIYAALLYSSDKEEYKDIKIGDKTAEELLNEFKKKTEDNPDDAYREFTELWQNAYENLGYFYVKMGDTLQETPLFAKDGTPMVGRYGEKNSRSNLSSNYSMALVALYSSSMDAYNAGNKAENINPDFIEADGAGWFHTLWTDISRTIMADAGIILSGAAGGILGAATGTAAGPVVGNIIGGLVGTGIALYNAVTDPDPFGPGDYGYDVARNNKSSELLRKAVNPLSEALWGLDDEEDPINFGASYEFIHGVGEFASGILTNVVAMSAETVFGAGLEAVGTRLVTSLKRGVGSAAKKLLSAGQQEAIKSVKGAAANIMAEDLANPTDEVTQNILANAARDAADPSDEILEGAAGKAAANVSGKADDAAAAAAKTRAAMDKAAEAAAKKLNSTANETTDAFMRVLSQLANGADNAAGFSQKLGQKAAPWLTEENVAKALVAAGVSNADDATVKAITNSLRQTITELGELASKETYRVALIAGFLGKSTDDVAKASSGVLEYLAKAIGKWYENPRAASNFSGIWEAQASGKMTMESIKRAFADVIDTSARALAAGMKYTKSDLVRQLARNGWSNKRIQLLFKDAILGKHGLIDDMLYDIVHGYTTPYIDDEGEARQVTVGEYFTDGYFLTSLGTNAVQTIGGALFRRLRLAATNKSLDKAHRALAATEYTDPDYAKRYNKVKQLAAKADKIVNDLMEKNLDYSKMQEVAKRGHQYIDEANNAMALDSAGRAKAVEKNFNRKTRAQQASFLKKRFRAPDAVAQKFVNAQAEALILFPEIRTALGGAEPNRLSTLEERSIIGKIWKAMANAADKYRNEIKNNKRFKTIWDKQAEMRRLQKEAAMEVLRGPDGGTSVEGVDSALDSWFNFIDDVAKKNVASGDMAEAQVRLGYLPTTGMLVGSPNDGVPTGLRCLWMGGKAGKAMTVESADPVARREINVQTLIDAYIKGETTITYTNASGKNVTAEFNPKGFEFVDAVMSYRNANTFHRTVGAILGGDAKTTGRAAMETGYVQFHGDKLSKAAATADRDNLDVEISAMEAKAKAKRTAQMQKADAKARKAAQKALSELAKREDSLLKQVGLHEVNAADMRASASLLRDIATKGRRPDNAPSVKDLFGVTDDSEAQSIFNRARARIESDIRKVQSGEPLSSTQKVDAEPIVTKPADYGTPEYTNRAKNLEDYRYERYLQDKNIASLKARRQSWVDNGYKNELGQDVRAQELAENGRPLEGTSKLERIDQQIASAEEKARRNDDAISKMSAAPQTSAAASATGNLPGQAVSLGDAEYERMIIEAARHNGAYDYDVVVRRMLLDNPLPKDLKAVAGSLEEVEFKQKATGLKLNYNEKTKKWYRSTVGDVSEVDMDKPLYRDQVNKELTRLISNNAGVSSDRGLKEQYMRVVQDAFSQARTIMDDQIKLADVEGGEGGFARGFFTFVDIVDRLLPDKELYNTAVNNKLVTRLNALGKDGITISQLKDSVLSKISIEKASGSNISDLITAYKVLDMIDDAGTRAAGSGSYTPGRPRSGEVNLDDDNEFSESISNGVANIFGRTVDTTDAYSREFSIDDLAADKPSSPVQIDYNKLNSKEKTIYDMVRSGVDLSNKSELKQALDTTASIISKLTNNGSKLYDANLRALRDNTAAVYKSANTVRDEINDAVSKLAKTDAETKALVDAEAARRSARQKQYRKVSTANAKYDGSAALGIARPGSAILYSANPSRYNAVASSLRKGDSGLANNVTALRGQGVHDAESILGYLRQNEPGVEELDSLINFDAGTPAGIYHQLRSAADYLKEKGVDTSSIDSQLADMRGRIGNLDSYGDIYGNTNPPEFSLAAALAEVENKTSFFPDNIRNGVDRMRTDEMGDNTSIALMDETTIDVGGEKVITNMSFGTSQGASDTAVGVSFSYVSGKDFDFKNLSDAERRSFAEQFNEQSQGFAIVKKSDYTSARKTQGMPVVGEDGRLLLNPDGTVKRFTAADAKQRLEEIKVEKAETAKLMAEAREFGDLSENAEYSAAISKMQLLENEESQMKAIASGRVVSGMDADIMQKLDEDWYLVSREERGWGDDWTGDYSRSTTLDEKWAEYLYSTKNKMSSDDLLKEADKLDKLADGAEKKASGASRKKVDIDDGSGKTKKKSLNSLKDDLQDINYKKYMTADEYARYNELKTLRNQADDFVNGKAEVYHSVTGATYNGDAPGYSNMVRASDFLKQYGYNPGSKEYTERKFDKKQMKKELRKGNLRSKKNWGKPEIDPTALPSTMDKESAELTVSHMLNFIKEVQAASNMQYIDMDQIWVDKSYLELLARYANTPNKPSKLIQFANKVASMSQFVQQNQLAGGFGPMNALVLAQIRSAIFENPTKAIQFARMMTDFRNSRSAVTSVLERSDLLAQIAMDTMDGTVVTDLFPAMSKRVGRDDGGVLQTFATQVLDRLDKSTSRYPKGFVANLKNDIEEFFENPTFAQALPVMRAQMLSMNYDAALTKLSKRFADRIGKDISIADIQRAARQVAYVRTQKFFFPQKFWNGDASAGIKKIQNENVRKLVGQITGEGTPTTVTDLASSAFFALRYKQTFVNRFVQGVRSFSDVPKMIRNRLSNSASLDDMVETMSNAGQRQGIISLIGVTVLAKVWCDAMGIPNAWDDFDFTPEGDEEFHMPTVLMKFQNAGQIWLPNDTREDGTPYVNPNKRAYKLDPFFSMFTLPNSVMRSVDMFFNGDVNSYRAPQGGIGLLTNSLGVDMYGINQFFNSPQWRAISDELIGSNLLSPYKAMHEIIVNRTYYGNNIWERKYLPDGTENPNYDPGRNVASSIMHLLGLDAVLDPNGYNRWVKGGDEMVYQDQIGTIAGSGILQHEYITAAISLMNGDLFDAMIEAGELPIKTQTLSSDARTEMNTTVKNTLAHYSDSYHAAIKKARTPEEKDKAYAEYVKKCADEMARWSAKYDYLLGENQQLVASATRLVMAMTSGEYDDNLAYIQNAYWKASKIAQIESGTNLFLGQDDLDDWIADGGTVESFIAEKNRRSAAYNQALDDEYEARKALIEANYNPEYLTSYSYEDLKAEQRSISKKIYTSIMNKFENRVGEFDNYKEMQEYYLEMINNASTTRQKAKLANTYNAYVEDVIAEAIADYGPAVLTETSYNGDGITNQISDYIIIPADKYYTGKTPKSNYLKDRFGVGYRNRVNLPSDDELVERWDTAKWLVANGKPASASALLESVVKNIKNGRLYASDVDYSNIIRLKSKLRSKQ